MPILQLPRKDEKAGDLRAFPFSTVLKGRETTAFVVKGKTSQVFLQEKNQVSFPMVNWWHFYFMLTLIQYFSSILLAPSFSTSLGEYCLVSIMSSLLIV